MHIWTLQGLQTQNMTQSNIFLDSSSDFSDLFCVKVLTWLLTANETCSHPRLLTPPVNASSKAMHCSLSRQDWFAVCGVKFSHCGSCLGDTQCLDLKWPLDGQVYLHSSNDALISEEGVSATQSEQQEEKRGREEGRTSTSGREKVFVGAAFMQH